MFLKSGNLYKLGDGPINYDWNLRYFVLDSKLFSQMICPQVKRRS